MVPQEGHDAFKIATLAEILNSHFEPYSLYILQILTASHNTTVSEFFSGQLLKHFHSFILDSFIIQCSELLHAEHIPSAEYIKFHAYSGTPVSN